MDKKSAKDEQDMIDVYNIFTKRHLKKIVDDSGNFVRCKATNLQLGEESIVAIVLGECSTLECVEFALQGYGNRILHRNISYDICRTQWFRGSYQFCLILCYGWINGRDSAKSPHRTEYAQAYDAGCFGHKTILCGKN